MIRSLGHKKTKQNKTKPVVQADGRTQGWIKWYLPKEHDFRMKISSIDFLTQTGRSHRYIGLVFKTWLQVISLWSTHIG